ncbi:thiopeptide-type bacteriocin biosynthesis domain-containing protein [Pedobacter westerhofensis]|uniref:Thiopeptide-type bacteriocin biosynthesis domain-containing protein n=1 Tax=Pedobacter westerhofensis TaxID=425512 RepID=A0A521ETW2_9SPHI|nr:lantibiotic dehydratase [Pedobacter westerhofensis]SMO87344.1 thiopeptide-type bacteriocin biosynthesis domain-containing protein [Pedobacter westerhofensis]
MKLTFSPLSICRTPVFSVHEEPGAVWDKLKEYIHESSPAFFEVIKDLDYSGLGDLDIKIRFTIWKYFNRAKFRATPYGNFAAFSLVPVLRQEQPGQIILSASTIEHRFPNWQEKERINFDPKYLSNHALFVRTNTSGYVSGNELRYLNIEDGAFELSAISASRTITETLKFCRLQRTLSELRDFLHSTHRLSFSLSNYFIEQLIGTQLLLTDFQPNITGTDYFSRLGFTFEEKKNDYIIAERKHTSGHIPEKPLHIIREIISFLNQYLVPSDNSSLKDFKTKFVKRFEQKKIPLMVAMDPEIGIGYRSLTQNKEEDQLIQDLKIYRQQVRPSANSIGYSALHQFLLNGMMQQKTVQLEQFKDEDQQNQVSLPNTFSVMLHYDGENLIIRQIGGCTANALLGRFSMASDEITFTGNNFARLEQDANPGVLFFDIAYQIEKNADNINRRKSIYEYEVPILSWSESNQIIDPDDILLSVENDELVLHSLKYKKRIVPKLASAYNYTRSDLSVYRFLSDLQHQNIRSDLNINLTEMFPGLIHYQRLQYKNVVLSPEKWLIPNHVCNWKNMEQALPACKEWLYDINLKNCFKCGFADQTLIFNPAHTEDLTAFLLFCKNRAALYIEETFISAPYPVHDDRHQPYLSEFIVNFEHRQQVYQPYPLQNQVDHPHIKSAFLPGEEWVYFEIYCQPGNSDALLLLIARDYLRMVKKKLKNWFFIRYGDPSYHIRLRLKARQKDDIAELVSGLSHLLSPYFKSGMVSDLQLKTYQREMERYGPERIDLVEKCFGRNSSYVLYLVGTTGTVNFYYHQSILLIEEVMHSAGFSTQEQLSFTEKMAAQFAAEIAIPSEGSKQINVGYKKFIADTEAVHPKKTNQKKITAICKYFLDVLEKCDGIEKEKMLFDLFHMHTNRLFSTDQRMHEMIMYYYLTKKIKTRIGRLQQSAK